MPSKKPSKKFKYRPTHAPGRLPHITTQWDLNELYESLDDPRLEKDVTQIERQCARFAQKYNSQNFVATAEALRTALDAYMRLMAKRLRLPIRYLHFRVIRNVNDSAATQQLNVVEERLVKAFNELIFFTHRIAAIDSSKQELFLKDPKLKPYTYWLQKVFAHSKHLLDDTAEQVLRRKTLPSRQLWVRGTRKILGSRSIIVGGTTWSLQTALETIPAADPQTRKALWGAVTTELASIAEFAEHELQAIVLDTAIDNDLRKYTHPTSATVQDYENEPETVAQLIDTVSTTGFRLSKRFYRTKAAYHGLEKLSYEDRFAEVGVPLSFTFNESVAICRDVFYGLKHEYGVIFDDLVSRGRVDVFPRSGKQGGAFMSSSLNEPTFVKLNHTNTLSSLLTLAHEMGHAIHSCRTYATQPTQYSDYSTVTAETASTFFERAVFAALLEQANTADRQTLLHYKISNDIATMQRQIAFYNFELAMHDHVRNHGGITRDALAKLLQQKLKAYLGPAVSVTKQDGYSFVYIEHFRMRFYVYAYAYGHLMSEILFARVQEDPQYIKQVDQLLSAGNSASVETLFRKIDIDPGDPDTLTYGLHSLESLISEFTQIHKTIS